MPASPATLTRTMVALSRATAGRRRAQRARRSAGPGPPGQAEVADLGRAVLCQQDITRLEVAMDDPFLVGVLHGAGQGADQGGGPARLPRGAVEVGRQTAAGTELEGEVGQSFGGFPDL